MLIDRALRHQASRPSARYRVMAVLLGLAPIALATHTLAQTTEMTQPRDDPRRARGALVTREINPGRDVKGQEDPARVDEAYQPKGIELGQFLLFPKTEFTGGYNDNVFAQKNNPRGDFLTRITPEAELRSRFSQHQLNFLGRAEQTVYRRYEDDNTLDLLGAMNGRLDVSRDWELPAAFSLFQRFEDRGSPEDVGGKKPTRVRGGNARVGSKSKHGRYVLHAEAGVDRLTYADVATSTGTEVNNSDRDRWEYELRTRGSYELFPGYAAVLEFAGNQRIYDEPFDDNGFARDSQGYRALGGVAIDLSEVIRGDFLAGYFAQNYEDRRLSDPSGLALRAQFNWTPSRMTIVVPSFERVVQETTQPGSSSIVRIAANLVVRHELERNIVLTFSAGASQDDFEGINQRNRTYEGRIRAIWALAPEYYVGAEAGHRYRTSNVEAAGFSQTVVLARFGLRL